MDGCSSFNRLCTERQVSLDHQCLITGCSCPCFTASIVQWVVCLGYRLLDLQLFLFHSRYGTVGGVLGLQAVWPAAVLVPQSIWYSGWCAGATGSVTCSCPCFTVDIVQRVVFWGYRQRDMQLSLFHIWYSAVGVVFGLQADDLQLNSWHEQGVFLFSSTSRPVLGPI